MLYCSAKGPTCGGIALDTQGMEAAGGSLYDGERRKFYVCRNDGTDKSELIDDQGWTTFSKTASRLNHTLYYPHALLF